MKRRDLEKRLKAAGWFKLRNGSDHDIWTNGTNIEAIPRHRELNENLAKGIIRKWNL